MRTPVKIALIAALPISLLNLLPPFAIDIGLPDNASRFQQFFAGEWVAMHWLGFLLNQFDPYSDLLFFVNLFLSGYIEWTVLLVAGFYAWLGVRRLAQGLSAKRA